MSNKLKGLSVDVMGTDATNNGVTSGKTRAILVGPDIDRVFEADGDSPALKLIPGRGHRKHIAVPYDTP